jgi:hypothetical protein
VRSNHVHSVVEAEVPPERVMSDFKACASRRLNRMRLDESGRKRRARHGSTRDGCGNQGMSWLPSIMWLMTTLMLVHVRVSRTLVLTTCPAFAPTVAARNGLVC